MPGDRRRQHGYAAPAIQWPCGSGYEQQWIIDPTSLWTTIVNVNSGQCLAVGSGATWPGAGVIQWPCDNGPEQLWYYGASPTTIVNYNSGLCLAIGGASTAPGTKALQWGCSGGPEQRWSVGFSLPLPRSALPRSEYDDPHHDYPGIDLVVGTGTPAYAVRSGIAYRVSDGSCGLGIRLSGDDGATYIYCHLSAWSVASGTRVGPGMRIGSTGNTGNSTGPHLHFGISTGTTYRCPQTYLLAIYDGLTPPAATSLPTTGCTF